MSDVEPPDLGLDAALAVLEAPPGDVGPLLAGADEAMAAVRRQPLAAIAALAWSLPPEQPAAGLRERLMERLSGDETQMISPVVLLGTAATAAPATTALAAPPAPPSAAAAAVPERGGAPVRPIVAPTPARRSPAARPPAPRLAVAPPRRWAWPAVASLAAALIALGVLSAGLWQELGRTREQLRSQTADREALAGRVAALERESGSVTTARDELAALQGQLALVTAPTTEVCPLRPPAGRRVAPQARGLLYVAEDHQHWYLRAEGLAPPGEGRVYHLWFVVGERPVSAGSFRLDGDEAALTSPTMPPGTRAAVVTVEPAAGIGERPSGPVVLYGSEMSRLL